MKAFMAEIRPDIDGEIDTRIGEASDDPGRLKEAMRYAALGPGKRLRPTMTVAACLAAGGPRSAALPAAAAIEMLHAYTLVHDDLPSLDNDVTRRGRPSLHVAFDEATAILVGDALLTTAFGALADIGPRVADAVSLLARRAGADELIRGQVMDLALGETTGELDLEELEQIHWRKTGALFAAAAELGGLAADAEPTVCAALGRYGMNIGIAFQYADDRDDREHQAHRERAHARMKQLTDEAMAIARELGEPGRWLQAIASWIGGVA